MAAPRPFCHTRIDNVGCAGLGRESAGGTSCPLAPNLNLLPGQTVPNLVIAKVGRPQGRRLQSAGTTHVIFDVVGWYGPA